MRNLKDILVESMNEYTPDNFITKDEYKKILDMFKVSSSDQKLLLDGWKVDKYISVTFTTDDDDAASAGLSDRNDERLKYLDIPWEDVEQIPNLDVDGILWFAGGNGLNTIIIDTMVWDKKYESGHVEAFVLSNNGAEVDEVREILESKKWKESKTTVYDIFLK